MSKLTGLFSEEEELQGKKKVGRLEHKRRKYDFLTFAFLYNEHGFPVHGIDQANTLAHIRIQTKPDKMKTDAGQTPETAYGCTTGGVGLCIGCCFSKDRNFWTFTHLYTFTLKKIESVSSSLEICLLAVRCSNCSYYLTF